MVETAKNASTKTFFSCRNVTVTDIRYVLDLSRDPEYSRSLCDAPQYAVSVYIGIDQALQKIGLAVLRDGEVALLKYIQPPEDARGGQRLVALRDALQIALEPFAEATGVAMEGQSYNSIGQLDQLGQIAGVVQMFIIDKYKVAPVLVPPTVLKKFVAGVGQATKVQMMKHTLTTWNVSITNDDICDAHGLARMAQQIHEPTTRVRHQLEAIRTITVKKRRKKRLKPLLPKTV